MNLSDDQKKSVSRWVEEGLNLSDIQKNISAEFGVSMTYMDVRFLVLDLGVTLADKPEPEKKVEKPAAEAGVPAGQVSVTIDTVVKAGALASGNVTFSDGVAAAWVLDNAGRLALDAGSDEYRPTEEDITAFQMQLKALFEKKGL